MTALFFDLDGTLVDVRDRHYCVYSLACEDAGMTPIGANDYWRRCRRGASTFNVISPEDTAQADAFRRRWLESIEQPEFVLRDRLFPGVEESLRQLAEAGCQLVLATLRRNRTSLMLQMESLGLAPWFVQVLSPMEAADNDKAALIARCGYDAGDVVIGDSESDVAAAKSLGIASVCVTTGVRSPAYLRGLTPTHLVASVRALPAFLAEADAGLSRRSSSLSRALSG